MSLSLSFAGPSWLEIQINLEGEFLVIYSSIVIISRYRLDGIFSQWAPLPQPFLPGLPSPQHEICSSALLSILRNVLSVWWFGPSRSGGPSDPLRELFEACKSGDAESVRALVTPSNVNAKDTSGRGSSPLHFSAGYGRRSAVEILLLMGANVSARDDGGLIPLHNACSFGHAEDNWSYTPLHEAAVKGKTDICILLLQHGAD
ncbi:Poly polymerase, partial [Caligus rogercresseyi]